MIVSLIAATSLSATLQTTTLVESLNTVSLTLDPAIVENYPSFVYELEHTISEDSYVGQPITFSTKNTCDSQNLYLTTLSNAGSNPNVGIIQVLNDADPSKGGQISISIENIEFSNSINDPRDEFTPAGVLLSTFQGQKQVGIDPGYYTSCDPTLTQCVTLVR